MRRVDSEVGTVGWCGCNVYSVERYTLHTRLAVRDRAYLIAQHSVIHDDKTNEKHIHIYEQRIFSLKWYTRPNMQAVTPYFFNALPAISFLNCIPSKCMHSTPLYAFATASSSVDATAVEAMTRPPDVLRTPSSRVVPAWKRTVSVGVNK